MRVKSFKKFLIESDEERTYSFEELSSEAKEHAIEHARDNSFSEDWWFEELISDFESELEEIGISNAKIDFSGFHSQGDGASFTSDEIDTEKLFNAVGIKSDERIDMSTEGEREENKEFYDLIGDLDSIGQHEDTRIKPENIQITIYRRDKSYYHSNTISVVLDVIDEPDGWDGGKWLHETDYKVEKFIKSLADDFYRRLEKEYNYLDSDESISQDLIDNGYEFDEEGNRI